MPVRPLMLADTASKAGYDELDPISQWFLGGGGTAGAEATGINDDDRYGLDLTNAGSGGMALRATSGNGTHQVRVNNSGVTILGGLTVSGGALTVAGITSTNGFVVTTGASSFGGSATFSGVATFVSAVVMNATLAVTGAASFSTGVTVGGALTVTGPASFITNVNIVQGLTVSQSATIVGNLTTVGSLNVTGIATFVTDVTIQQGLTVSQSVIFGGNLTMSGTNQTLNAWDINVADDVQITGDLLLTSSTGAGATRSNWSGAFIIKNASGTNLFVPFNSSWP